MAEISVSLCANILIVSILVHKVEVYSTMANFAVKMLKESLMSDRIRLEVCFEILFFVSDALSLSGFYYLGRAAITSHLH